MRRNKKGQALVEFVIILPIFIFMLFALIDFGKILYYQNNLESQMDEVITIYKSNKSVDTLLNEEKIELDINEKDNYLEFNLSKDIDIITPGLSLILGSDYKPHVKRVIYNE